MSVDILHRAMNQADSDDARQRAKCTKYRQYMHPHDHRVALYFTTNIVVVLLEEDQEPVDSEVVEEVVVTMIVRAPEPGHRSMPIELDSGRKRIRWCTPRPRPRKPPLQSP
ncbi:hypothetical protein D1007_34651 [Hordeum vulgare]|nr:hypothetical protein D1007_34651 [Hordeum vulgare]